MRLNLKHFTIMTLLLTLTSMKGVASNNEESNISSTQSKLLKSTFPEDIQNLAETELEDLIGAQGLFQIEEAIKRKEDIRIDIENLKKSISRVFAYCNFQIAWSEQPPLPIIYYKGERIDATGLNKKIFFEKTHIVIANETFTLYEFYYWTPYITLNLQLIPFKKDFQPHKILKLLDKKSLCLSSEWKKCLAATFKSTDLSNCLQNVVNNLSINNNSWIINNITNYNIKDSNNFTWNLKLPSPQKIKDDLTHYTNNINNLMNSDLSNIPNQLGWFNLLFNNGQIIPVQENPQGNCTAVLCQGDANTFNKKILFYVQNPANVNSRHLTELVISYTFDTNNLKIPIEYLCTSTQENLVINLYKKNFIDLNIIFDE